MTGLIGAKPRCPFGRSAPDAAVGAIWQSTDRGGILSSRPGGVMLYGYIGSMKTKPGRRDDVVSILLAGVDGLREAGCHLYVVGSAHADDNTIWVNEVWASKSHHHPGDADAHGRVHQPRIHGPGWRGRVARLAEPLPLSGIGNRLPIADR